MIVLLSILTCARLRLRLTNDSPPLQLAPG